MRAALDNGGETTMQARKKQMGGGGRGMGPAMIGQRFRTFDPSDDKVAVTSSVLNRCIMCILPAAPGDDGLKSRYDTQAQVNRHFDAFVLHESKQGCMNVYSNFI